MAVGVLLANSPEGLSDPGQHGLDPSGHGRRGRSIGRGEEVGQACDDANRGLRSNFLQGLGKNLEVAARDDLGRLRKRTCPERRLAHVPLDIGVPDEAKTPRLRHDEHEVHEDRALSLSIAALTRCALFVYIRLLEFRQSDRRRRWNL